MAIVTEKPPPKQNKIKKNTKTTATTNKQTQLDKTNTKQTPCHHYKYYFPEVLLKSSAW